MIYVIRNQRVLLDEDLAELYGVKTKRLNEQVKRNSERFPEDFMFQLSEIEFTQIQDVIDQDSEKWGGRRYPPFAFTETGVAMLSSVLSSPRAISVNIAVMRTFVRLRSFLSMDNSVSERLSNLEKGANKLFRVVFERLDQVEETIAPKLHPKRKKIGLK
ncbi:MAG TPA: ORF6N domain-containing protein [Bacteriovoracaceae bacterium]|nr:ORF6N domain-containing protein [Bacteriovoracaceae bacterium]